MIPNPRSAIWESENAAMGKDPKEAAVPPVTNNNYNPAMGNTHCLSMMTSHYLNRIPSITKQWENNLQDMMTAKIQRSRRSKYEKESVNDFLQRFPIEECP